MLKTQFQLFDPENTGHITQASLQLLLPAHSIRATPGVIAQLVNELDTNQNGLIEFDEFMRVRDEARWKAGEGEREESKGPDRWSPSTCRVCACVDRCRAQLAYRLKKGGTSNWRQIMDATAPSANHLDLAEVRARRAPHGTAPCR